ncbi:MAG TPA: transcriptional regulator GutM [Lichenihabitans sp.]|nr:transcriptional regulator GutM [Lichenihabitans sp.]
MPIWQIALIAVLAAWCLQGLGTYIQMRHYTAVMGEVTRLWADGFVGAGNARATLGRGVILLLVVSPDRIVRRLMVMQGRSVFARFARVPDVEGRAFDGLDAASSFSDEARRKALSIAVQQIEKAAARGPVA